MTLTTVVRVHSLVGHVYWGVVRFFHPVVVRSLMRHTAHPAGVLAPFNLPRTTARDVSCL